jgi:hypothetical protein
MQPEERRWFSTVQFIFIYLFGGRFTGNPPKADVSIFQSIKLLFDVRPYFSTDHSYRNHFIIPNSILGKYTATADTKSHGI